MFGRKIEQNKIINQTEVLKQIRNKSEYLKEGINLDNAVQPDSCINMMYFMYLWLPFIFDIIITVILSFLNVESANMKLKENMQNQ